MDFAALPPEVNSGLMYTGPGSAPMIDRRSILGQPGQSRCIRQQATTGR